ncbi:MAG: right-handed parallel beta-helix repeat-containing protein [bacterium]|nr:right-handed parallel beta-helix repeat-containing protein [bacterium]
MKRIFACCIAVLSVTWCAAVRADTHYVSPGGSEEPPYLTPETAARSIQSALDVASPGDTVSAAAGDYRGRIAMGPALSLVGCGPEATRIWGAIEAGVDGKIEGVGVHQDCPPEDPAYAWVAIKGPRTGGLTVSRCRISGTYEKGIKSMADTGFVLVLETEIRGIRTGLSPVAISAEGTFHGLRSVVWVIDRCTVSDNALAVGTSDLDGLWVTRSRFFGNGVAVSVWCRASLVACQIVNNAVGVSLGYDGGAPTLVESCLIAGNTEAGVSCSEMASMDLENCTITGNGRGLELIYTQPYTQMAVGCIIWGNTQDVRVEGREPSFDILAVGYSDIGGWEGNENIDTDPLFLDPGTGNFRLRPDSPCIDYDTPYAASLEAAYDLDGGPRVAYGGKGDYRLVDMGAYEYQINRLSPGPGPAQLTLTWSSSERSTYSIFYTDDLFNWHLAIASFPSSGNQTTSWLDDGSLTGVPPLLAPKRFYRLLENP